eukprot:4425425-Amphidinium_carterae.2
MQGFANSFVGPPTQYLLAAYKVTCLQGGTPCSPYFPVKESAPCMIYQQSKKKQLCVAVGVGNFTFLPSSHSSTATHLPGVGLDGMGSSMSRGMAGTQSIATGRRAETRHLRWCCVIAMGQLLRSGSVPPMAPLSYRYHNSFCFLCQPLHLEKLERNGRKS